MKILLHPAIMNQGVAHVQSKGAIIQTPLKRLQALQTRSIRLIVPKRSIRLPGLVSKGKIVWGEERDGFWGSPKSVPEGDFLLGLSRAVPCLLFFGCIRASKGSREETISRVRLIQKALPLKIKTVHKSLHGIFEDSEEPTI
jgi:hypothetical protein